MGFFIIFFISFFIYDFFILFFLYLFFIIFLLFFFLLMYSIFFNKFFKYNNFPKNIKIINAIKLIIINLINCNKILKLLIRFIQGLIVIK